MANLPKMVQTRKFQLETRKCHKNWLILAKTKNNFDPRKEPKKLFNARKNHKFLSNSQRPKKLVDPRNFQKKPANTRKTQKLVQTRKDHNFLILAKN